MAILSTTGGSSVTIDESAGLLNDFTSNLIGDLEDNDIALSVLTSASSPALAFSTRLTALGAGTPTDVALSGYNGSNTGLNAFTITPSASGVIADLRFSDSSGNALQGLDSQLTTVNGVKIYLYTDTVNNNILLGRAATATGLANPSGAIVFAAYIEETTSLSGAGGKIWTTLYQPLHHNDPTNPDDSVSLLNKVFIAAIQDTSFSLANAPSGQNLFLMFTTATPTVVDGRITGVSIIATGKDPANQSGNNPLSTADDINITTGDTINTSQAGGPTTFGTNSQMITEQEGIRFTFVTGAKQGFTIPSLDQNEADVEQNIDFTAVFGARTATFDVVQLQSGKSAQVKITALKTTAETGVNFIDGYSNDTTVAITNVRVINISTGLVIENSDGSANDTSINISNGTFASGVATITGVKAGYKIEYTTTADHNRLLVENGAALNASGNNHADFDIGGFKLLQASTETIEIGSKISFEDDGPSISTIGTEPTLTVDESDLDTNDTMSFSSNFTSAFGADGAGTLTYALGVVAGDSGLVDTATGEVVNLALNGTVVEGRTATSNALVFQVSVATNGEVKLDQLRAVVHPVTSNPDDSRTLAADNLVTLTATKTDKDGDSAQATLNIGQNLNFEDDGPSIAVSVVAAADALTVDETLLGTDASADYADNFANVPNYGADNAGSVSSVYTLAVKSEGVDSGLDDVATGNSVFLYLEAGQVVARVGSGPATPDSNGDISFTVSVDETTGTVSLDQRLAMQHPNASNPDDAVSPSAADLISLTRTDTITDKDGDQKTASNTLDIADALSFEDDGPSIAVSVVAPADALTVDESTLDANASANYADNFANVPNYGADNAGSVSSAYTLAVKSAGVDSGLDDVATGNSVFLYLEAGQVVARVGSGPATPDSNGDISFTVSVDETTGTVSLDQRLAMQHPNASNPDDAVSPGAADLISLTRTDTITDKDGDQSTAANALNIAAALSFKDDGPSIAVSVVAPADALTVDETLLGTNASADYADNFANVPNYGADDAGSVSSAYTLAVKSAGVDSGLDDVASGNSVFLYLDPVSGQVVARVGSGPDSADPLGDISFTVSVSASGEVTLDQVRAMQHPNASNPDDAVSPSAADLISLTRTDTITDKDGDQSTAANALNIAAALSFKDDGPSIAVSVVAPADALTVDETLLGTNASADYADNFANVPNYGADDAGSVSSAYTLAVKSAGVDSGLDDVASGNSVFLYLEAGQVVARVGSGPATPDSNGDISFTVSVDETTGTVSLDQRLAMQHPNASNPDDAVSPSAADLISLTRTDTITDKDGDQKTASNTLDIAAALSFEDDGPSISTTGTEPTLTVDESDLATNDTMSFASNFTSAFGADGAGTLTYALGVVAGDSGLVDTATGQVVNLALNGTVVEGRTATSNDLVFQVSVATNGEVKLDQLRAVVHPVTSNPDDSRTLAADNLVTLTATKTDKDGDSAQATLNIGQNLNFEDDGPAIITKTDLVYANSSNPTPGGAGIFDYKTGADIRLTFGSTNSDFSAITLTGTVGTSVISSATVTWFSETASTAVFNVAFNYQADPASTASTAATGTLTFNKISDTYTVALAQPISGFSTLSTANALGFTGYTAGTSTIDQTQPDVSVATLSTDFFVQFTGISEPGGGTGTNNLQALAPSTNLGGVNGSSFLAGELFKQAATWVSVSNTANGVAGDTIQQGEVLDLDFFNTNPTGFTSLTPTTQASGIFLKFDGIGSEDLVVVLKLVLPDGTGRTTKAIIIDNADIIKFGGTIPAGYNIVLDNNDGAVIIESNDFNTGSQNYLIEGAQLLVSTEGVTGTAINLNPATGASGGSTTTQDFGAATTDNDVIKISDIGFVTSRSGTLNANLSFNVSVVDADGDSTSAQTLDVGIVSGTSLSPTSSADVFTFTEADADGLLAGIMYNITGGFATGIDKLDFPAVSSTTNYAENLVVVTNVSDFIAAADTALNGTVQYYFGVVGSDGYLATDTDGNGITSIVKLAGVTDLAFSDII